MRIRAALAVLLLAACGGREETRQPDQTTTAAEPPTATQPEATMAGTETAGATGTGVPDMERADPPKAGARADRTATFLVPQASTTAQDDVGSARAATLHTDMAGTTKATRRRAVTPRQRGTTPITNVELATRQGVAFPVTYPAGAFRYNLQILTAPLPDQVWSNPDFRAAIREEGGRFPVKLWRLRDGRAVHVQTIWCPAHAIAFVQHRLDDWIFQRGDIAVLEYTPGMMVVSKGDGSGFIDVPFGSQIDNRSGDPVTWPGVRTNFKVTAEVF